MWDQGYLGKVRVSGDPLTHVNAVRREEGPPRRAEMGLGRSWWGMGIELGWKVLEGSRLHPR